MLQSEVKRTYLGIIEATIASVREELSADPDERSMTSQLTLLEQYWSKRVEDRKFDEDPELKVAPTRARGGKRTRGGKVRQGHKKSAKKAKTRAASASELSSKDKDDEANLPASTELITDFPNVSDKTNIDRAMPDSNSTNSHPLRSHGKENGEPVLSIGNVVEVTPTTTLYDNSAVHSNVKGSASGPSSLSKIQSHQLRSAGDAKDEVAKTDDDKGCVEPHLMGGPTAVHSSHPSEQQSRPQPSCLNTTNKNVVKSEAKRRAAPVLEGSSNPVPTGPNKPVSSTAPSDERTGEARSKSKPKISHQDHNDEEICSKEDLDSSDSDVEYILGRDEDEDADQFILAQFVGKPKMRNVCRFTLRNGIVCIRGRDYLFQKATCSFDPPSKSSE